MLTVFLFEVFCFKLLTTVWQLDGDKNYLWNKKCMKIYYGKQQRILKTLNNFWFWYELEWLFCSSKHCVFSPKFGFKIKRRSFYIHCQVIWLKFRYSFYIFWFLQKAPLLQVGTSGFRSRIRAKQVLMCSVKWSKGIFIEIWSDFEH